MAKLFFRYGTMGSSKSMDLLRTAYNYETKGMKPLLLKPSLDTRDYGVIRSRIGVERPCRMFGAEENLYQLISNLGEMPDCILLDEAQFMTVEQVHHLWEAVMSFDVPIICYGLKLDYQGQGFAASKELMVLANTVDELKTVCSCGRKATHHLLRINGRPIFEGDNIYVGDQQYESVCGQCWLRTKKSAINDEQLSI